MKRRGKREERRDDQTNLLRNSKKWGKSSMYLQGGRARKRFRVEKKSMEREKHDAREE